MHVKEKNIKQFLAERFLVVRKENFLICCSWHFFFTFYHLDVFEIQKYRQKHFSFCKTYFFLLLLQLQQKQYFHLAKNDISHVRGMEMIHCIVILSEEGKCWLCSIRHLCQNKFSFGDLQLRNLELEWVAIKKHFFKNRF